MEFFDKIKNAVTGHGAKVSLEIVEPTIGREFTVNIKAKVAGEDLEIDGVYLEIKAVKLTVDEGPISNKIGNKVDEFLSKVDMAGKIKGVFDDIRGKQTFNMKMLVADAQKLEDKNEYNWAVKVIIPTAMEESFESDKEIHKWQFLAELNAFGTNPSSEWITVDMNKDKEALSA